MKQHQRYKLEIAYLDTEQQITNARDIGYNATESITRLTDALAKARERVALLPRLQAQAKVAKLTVALESAKAESAGRSDVDVMVEHHQRILERLVTETGESRQQIADNAHRLRKHSKPVKPSSTIDKRPVSGGMNVTTAMRRGWTEIQAFDLIGWTGKPGGSLLVRGTGVAHAKVDTYARTLGYTGARYTGAHGYVNADGETFLTARQFREHMLGIHLATCPRHPAQNLHKRSGQPVWCPKCQRVWTRRQASRYGRSDVRQLQRTSARELTQDIARLPGSPKGY